MSETDTAGDREAMRRSKFDRCACNPCEHDCHLKVVKAQLAKVVEALEKFLQYTERRFDDQEIGDAGDLYVEVIEQARAALAALRGEGEK